MKTDALRRRKIGASRVFKKRKTTSRKSRLPVFFQNEATFVSKELPIIERNALNNFT